MEKFFIFGVILVAAFVRVNSLQCYECYNCLASELKEEHLVTCGATITTTTVNPSTTAAPTTTPVNPSTTATPTTTPVNPSTTTVPTSAPVDSSITAAPTTTPINPSTTTVPTSAPVEPNGTSAPVDPTGANPNNPPQAFRVRRHVQPEIVELDSKCICYEGKCTCDEEPKFLRTFQYADNTTYVCAKGTMKVNGTDVVIRGCAEPKIGEQQFCDYAVANSNITDCSTCTSDKCNSGFVLQHSIGVLLLILTLIVLTK